MKVLIIPSDTGGSGFYRMQEPARVAQLHGLDINFRANAVVDIEGERFSNGQIVVHEIRHDADVIVLQRPLPQLHNALAIAAKRQGMSIVVDIDDDFHNVHRNNIAADAINHKISPLENLRWLKKTLALADVVTASTPALLKYAEGETKGVVVRNRLPEKILTLPRRPSCGLIGWTGSVSTHPEDLQQARGVLDFIGSPISIVGHAQGVAGALQVSADRVLHANKWQAQVPIYWRALNISMDVGIVPLETSLFNQAKSALKGLEYAALGKPFIASPLPEYRRLVEESGAGILAEGREQWARAAKSLLEDGDQYRRAGEAWAKENTLEKHIGDWISAWELALETNKS